MLRLCVLAVAIVVASGQRAGGATESTGSSTESKSSSGAASRTRGSTVGGGSDSTKSSGAASRVRSKSDSDEPLVLYGTLDFSTASESDAKAFHTAAQGSLDKVKDALVETLAQNLDGLEKEDIQVLAVRLDSRRRLQELRGLSEATETKNVIKVDYSITAPEGMTEASIVEKVTSISRSAVVSMANTQLLAAGITVQFTDLAPPSAPTPKSDDSDDDGEFPIVLVVVVASVGAVLLCAAFVFISCKKSMEARKRRESKNMEENKKETPVAEQIVLQIEPEVPPPPPPAAVLPPVAEKAPQVPLHAIAEDTDVPPPPASPSKVLAKSNNNLPPADEEAASTTSGGTGRREETDDEFPAAPNSMAFMMSAPPVELNQETAYYEDGPPIADRNSSRNHCNCVCNPR